MEDNGQNDEEKEGKKAYNLLSSKMTVITLLIIFCIIFTIFTFIWIREQDSEQPLISFREDPEEEGTYYGSVQKNTDYNVSDISLVLFDYTNGDTASRDLMISGVTVIVYDSEGNQHMNCTFIDKNQNKRLDKGDEFIVKNVYSGGMFRLHNKTGKLFYWYEF